jgi:SAM-dependent methyltransferase
MAISSPYVDPALYDVVYQKIQNDVPFYVDLARGTGGPVLELGCGTGRVLLPTLEAGVAIEGLDLDGGMLDTLRSKARARGLNARVYRGDMRDFTMPGRYRLITIPFRAFLHLLSTEEQLQALRCVREHLEPKGQLAFNVFYPSADLIKHDDQVRKLSIDVPHPATGYRVAVYDVNRYDAVQQRVTVEREIVEHDDRGPARATNVGFTLRWVYRWELELLLATAGFEDVRIYGGFDRRPLEHDTDEMVVLARRK